MFTWSWRPLFYNRPISASNPIIFRLLNVIIINTNQGLFCPWLALKWHLGICVTLLPISAGSPRWVNSASKLLWSPCYPSPNSWSCWYVQAAHFGKGMCHFVLLRRGQRDIHISLKGICASGRAVEESDLACWGSVIFPSNESVGDVSLSHNILVLGTWEIIWLYSPPWSLRAILWYGHMCELSLWMPVILKWIQAPDLQGGSCLICSFVMLIGGASTGLAWIQQCAGVA